jgi:hypothetical protein
VSGVKISGPKGPKPPAPPDDAAPAAPPFAERVGPLPAAEDLPVSEIAALAARIRSGELSARQAVDHLIEVVARRRAISPLQREQLESALKRLLADDPLMATQIDTLKDRG